MHDPDIDKRIARTRDWAARIGTEVATAATGPVGHYDTICVSSLHEHLLDLRTVVGPHRLRGLVEKVQDLSTSLRAMAQPVALNEFLYGSDKPNELALLSPADRTSLVDRTIRPLVDALSALQLRRAHA